MGSGTAAPGLRNSSPRPRLLRTVRVLLLALCATACGDAPGPGEIEGAALPDSVIRARAERQRIGADLRGEPRQILFGDLHVHSTYSFDAFVSTLPMMNGEGLHPVADACDFARYCSDLDFFSINDHAEALSPRMWRETKEMIRACNEVATDPSDPDLVAYVGWEWTNMGRTPEDHYGHKNVIFRELAEDRLPTRPIASRAQNVFGDLFAATDMLAWAAKLPFLDWSNRGPYFDLWAFLIEAGTSHLGCEDGVNTRELPPDCHESAGDPSELFEKLDQWGFDSLVIPHGTAWGWYTPPAANLDGQLRPGWNDPERQRLIEVYSGHGNSEEYRDWRAMSQDEDGAPYCPEPTDDYLPCCWRAGEIIEERCEDRSSETCRRRVEKARKSHLELGPAGHQSVSGEEVTDWLDCGVCRDCFLPAFNYRPAESAQYALAISNFEELEETKDGEPRRYRFGFIASSDNHDARPGTGYKEFARLQMTEARGPRDREWYERLYDHRREVSPEPVARSEAAVSQPMFNYLNPERGASFFLTGGLAAVHAAGRDRDSIWEALARRETYGTSGPRILLWFDLSNGPGGALPMGSEVALDQAPRFRVRAAGSFAQKPGCPADTAGGLSAARRRAICRGECYNPGDRRLRITRIEVVRVRPQIRPGEAVGPLVEDPWRVFACGDGEAGCSVEFEDPDFARGAREVAYYARAVQEPTPAVNGGLLRCEYDERGRCLRVDPCYADSRTPSDDDCLSDVEERAWSSPIFVRPAGEIAKGS